MVIRCTRLPPQLGVHRAKLYRRVDLDAEEAVQAVD